MREALETQIPEEWLRSLAQLYLTEEEKAKIEALGGWEKIMEELKKRLEEQKGRHQGGNKWIGTGGTSPYGADGYNPAGVRIGQKENCVTGRAVKVWDKRDTGTSTTGRTRHPQHQRSRYAACASSRAKARRTSSTSTAPSRAPRTRATSTSTCAPSGATP
jgi:hypothetical protein